MPSRIPVIVLLLACWATALLGAEKGDKLFFSRTFPGSVPEYFDVTVHTSGKVVYREALDDQMPIEFEAPSSDVSRLFEISEELGYFERPLTAPKRETAFTGTKVLRYTKSAGASSEVQYVFADEESVQELTEWFVRVADTEWHFINIERAVQFDRLGVNKAMLQFHAAFDKGRIVAPKQFLPLLQSIANDLKIVHLARSRAAGLAEQIETATISEE
jgi:hypothetical protein